MAQQKVTIELPPEFKSFTPVQRLAVGREILEFIRKRTAKGLDKDNEKFPKYSKQYTRSLDFENAGKSPSKINLELSGDMMAALKVLKVDSGNKITIGLESGDENNGKLEGNRLGTYGTDTPNPKKARDPLGIDTDDLRKILSQFDLSADDAEAVEAAREKTQSTLEQILKENKSKSGDMTSVSTKLKIGGTKLTTAIRRQLAELDEDEG